MTDEDEKIREWKTTRSHAAILAIVVINCILLVTAIYMDGTIRLHDEVTYQPHFAINESYVKAMEEELSRNITIHIAENAAQNVSIWKGDKLVCYIPRGA